MSDWNTFYSKTINHEVIEALSESVLKLTQAQMITGHEQRKANLGAEIDNLLSTIEDFRKSLYKKAKKDL